MRNDKPSATAYLIARGTYLLSRDPALGFLVPERAGEISGWFVQSRCPLSRSLDAITSFRPIAYALERLTIPGIKLHYALRKRYLEEIARDSLERGTRQVVIIGAGFDTLALRLHDEFPETEFFEVDHPATQREKKRVVETHRPPGGNLNFVALDLAHRNLEECLLAHTRYRADLDTLFIAEGLLMYLSPAEVDLIFQFIRRHSGSQSRFAFTFMEMRSDGRIAFHKTGRVVDAWLRFHKESFKWGVRRERLGEHLAARGFKLLEVVASEGLRNKYLTYSHLKRQRLAEGECISVAELD